MRGRQWARDVRICERCLLTVSFLITDPLPDFLLTAKTTQKKKIISGAVRDYNMVVNKLRRKEHKYGCVF